MPFVHHETICADGASEDGGRGRFDVIESDGAFRVWEEGYCWDSFDNLEAAIFCAERRARVFDGIYGTGASKSSAPTRKPLRMILSLET